MTDIIDNELLSLANIREQIIAHCKVIHSILHPLIEAENKSAYLNSYDDLKKINESTVILNQQTLESLSQKVLSEQSIKIDEFNVYLAHVRHNLRNPINLIKGYTDIFLEDLDRYEKETKNELQVNEIIRVKKELLRVNEITVLIIKLIDEVKTIDLTVKNTEVEKREIDFEEKAILQEFNKTLPILIVDDVDENCKLLERHLNSFGYFNVSIAHNGEEAIAMKESVALMLLDMEMPGMSGLEILTQLKKEISDRRISVIIISGYDTVDKSINCIKLGAEDFLTKPFNPDLLRVRLGVCSEKIWLYQKEKIYLNEIEVERQQYLELLNAVFPEMIVNELTETGTVAARDYKNVAILFVDIVSFTNYCDTHTPEEVLKHLQTFADICEKMAIKNHLQKLKTIGDSFLGVAGMLSSSQNPVQDCINCAMDLIKESKKLESGWQLHTGIHYGNVIGGIVGHRQYLFDIWGDNVNIAARVQSLSDPNTICLTKTSWEQVKGLYNVEPLGERMVKGKGLMEVYKINPAS